MNSTKNTAFDLATYVPVIDWAASASTVEMSRAATERRARLMESEDAHVRQAARGYAGALSGSKQSDALLKNSRMG